MLMDTNAVTNWFQKATNASHSIVVDLAIKSTNKLVFKGMEDLTE